MQECAAACQVSACIVQGGVIAGPIGPATSLHAMKPSAYAQAFPPTSASSESAKSAPGFAKEVEASAIASHIILPTRPQDGSA